MSRGPLRCVVDQARPGGNTNYDISAHTRRALLSLPRFAHPGRTVVTKLFDACRASISLPLCGRPAPFPLLSKSCAIIWERDTRQTCRSLRPGVGQHARFYRCRPGSYRGVRTPGMRTYLGRLTYVSSIVVGDAAPRSLSHGLPIAPRRLSCPSDETCMCLCRFTPKMRRVPTSPTAVQSLS